mgnify:CR=1 FL=1
MYKYVLKKTAYADSGYYRRDVHCVFHSEPVTGRPGGNHPGRPGISRGAGHEEGGAGTQRPLLVRYGHYMINMLHGDLGTSYKIT